MNKQFKKALSAVLSFAMIAGSIAVPIAASAEETLKSWKFDFGAAENTAEGYTAVSADKKYNATDGYGFLGLENGFAQDPRDDGWTMTQGYDLVLENGKKDTVSSADDDWVATTKRTEKEQDYISPIRFAVKVDTNTYYKVKIHLNRADASKDANVNLFTEKRHQHLLNEPIPAEGMVYEASVYVHNNWSKNTSEYVDKMLNIVAEGENVAISSVEIEQTEQGKTLWVLGDSTVCEQTAPIPYFPLDHCQGVGSAMPKYISSDWALVNEAESGLSASASANHFNNMKNDIKAGDVVWFEFGHNDDKITNDPATNGYLTNLESFYNTVTEKGANMIVAAPIQRCTAGQYNDGTWTASLAQYGTAASNFVETQIAAGKTNIAYLDLNAGSLAVLNELQTEIDAQRAEKNLATLGNVTLRFYYYTSKYAGYDNSERTHPNDYGADNFAKAAIDEAKEKIAAAETDNATTSQKTQANVLKLIFDNTRNYNETRVAAEVVQDGAAPNSYYPTQLAKVVMYEYPVIINSVTFTDENKPEKMTAKIVPSDLAFTYGKAVIDIYDKDNVLKGTVQSSNAFDVTAAETQTVSFEASDVVFDSAAGDTFRAYVKLMNADTFELEDTVISSTYTQNDMIDVKEYLLQGNVGTENKEDFSTYNLADGDTIIGKNGWTNPGGETFAFKQEGEKTYAHCVTTGSATYYPEKKFTAVSSGQLYCRMDVRYISGTFNLYFTDGTILNNWPDGRIQPVQIVTENGEVKVKLNGEAVATINSGEWVTLALTIDMDYGKYSLSLNGETYTAEFAAYQSMNSILTPSNLSLIAFQNDKSSNEYDVTNIVLATLNTAPLPERTLTVASEDETKGTVSIASGSLTSDISLDYDGEKAVVTAKKADASATLIEAKYTADGALEEVNTTPLTFTDNLVQEVAVTEGSKLMLWNSVNGMQPMSAAVTASSSLTTTMNSIVSAVAKPKDGYEFDSWVDDKGNAVSYAAKYDIRLHEDLTVTAKFKEAVFDPITYTYKEDFSALATGTLAANGWKSTNAQANMTIEQDADHGNYLQFAPGDANSRGMVKDLSSLNLTKDYVVELDFALKAGNDQNTVFAIVNSIPAGAEINNGAPKYIAALEATANSESWTVNASTDTATIPKEKWVHMQLVVGGDNKTSALTITDGTETIYNGNIEAVGDEGTALKGIYVRSGRKQGVTLIDNVRIYTADQLTSE